jgi:hypothetical protein
MTKKKKEENKFVTLYEYVRCYRDMVLYHTALSTGVVPKERQKEMLLRFISKKRKLENMEKNELFLQDILYIIDAKPAKIISKNIILDDNICTSSKYNKD